MLHNNSFGSPQSTRGLSSQRAGSISRTSRNLNPYLNVPPSDQPIPPMEHSEFQNYQRVALRYAEAVYSLFKLNEELKLVSSEMVEISPLNMRNLDDS